MFPYGVGFLDNCLSALKSVCHRLKYEWEVHFEIMGNLQDPYLSPETSPWFPDFAGGGGYCDWKFDEQALGSLEAK